MEILSLGLDDDAILLPPQDTYALPKPLCFYGGSIMHGSSSRPGLSYPALIGRLLNADVWNFGYSGVGKGEPFFAREMARRDAACYILGYGENNKEPELMRQTHYPFLQILKEIKPDTPAILLAPTRRAFEVWNRKQRAKVDEFAAITRESYERGLAAGMRELYYIDTFFPVEAGDLTLDKTHLSDAGAFYAAEKLAPQIAAILKI